MKTFKSFIRRKPGAGFEGTNEVRKDHISKTPYQKDPITNEKPTPHLEESNSNDPYDWDTIQKSLAPHKRRQIETGQL